MTALVTTVVGLLLGVAIGAGAMWASVADELENPFTVRVACAASEDSTPVNCSTGQPLPWELDPTGMDYRDGAWWAR